MIPYFLAVSSSLILTKSIPVNQSIEIELFFSPSVGSIQSVSHQICQLRRQCSRVRQEQLCTLDSHYHLLNFKRVRTKIEANFDILQSNVEMQNNPPPSINFSKVFLVSSII